MTAFLKLMNFTDIYDLAIFSVFTKNMLAYATVFGIGVNLIPSIEWLTGLNIMFVIFIIAGSLVDILLGVYSNVIYKKGHFESSKFFRGIVKMFIVFSMVVLLNTLVLGVHNTEFMIPAIGTGFEYAVTTIQYGVLFLISLVILLGIAENGAKMEIPVFKSIARFIRMKIKKVETGVEQIYVSETNEEEEYTEEGGELDIGADDIIVDDEIVE